MNGHTLQPVMPALGQCWAQWAQFLGCACQCQDCFHIGRALQPEGDLTSFTPPQDAASGNTFLLAYPKAARMLQPNFGMRYVNSIPDEGKGTDISKVEPSSATSPETSRRPAVSSLSIPQGPTSTDSDTPSTAVNGIVTDPWHITMNQEWSPASDATMANNTAPSPSTDAPKTSDLGQHHCSPALSDYHGDSNSGSLGAGPYSPVVSSQAPLAPVAPCCGIIVPAAVQVRCPCCPLENNCPRRFLHWSNGKLPADLIEHAAQMGILIPPKRQPDLQRGSVYPQCNFPGCQDRPKYPWHHISNKHLESLAWKCACNPNKSYSSRNSINNHRKRVAKREKTPAIPSVQS